MPKLFALASSAVLTLALAAVTFSLAIEQIGRPFPGFLPAANGIVSQLELPDWPGIAEGLRFNDRIVRVEGKEIGHGSAIWDAARSAGVGAIVSYDVERPGPVADSSFLTGVKIRVERFGFADFVTVFLTAWGTGVGLCLCGILLAALRPDDRSVTAFLLVALSAGVMLMTAFDYYTSHMVYRMTPVASAAFSGSVAQLGAVLLEPTFGRQRLRIPVLVAWALAVLIGVGLEVTMFSSFHVFVFFTRLVFLSLGLSVIAFTGASIAATRIAPTPRARRRARIQAIGIGGFASIPLVAAMLSANAGLPLPVGLLAPVGLGVTLVVPYVLAALVDEDRVIKLIFRDRYEEYQALQRALEERVRNRTAALNDAARELRLYYRALSHDLRRPVVNLTNALKLARPAPTGASTVSPGSAPNDLALQSAQEALSIVDSILSAGRDVMRAEPKIRVDFAELIQEVVDELQPEITAKNAAVITRDSLPTILGERNKLKHAVRNLLQNAITYHAQDRAPRVTVQGNSSQDGTRSITFSDNGIGIAPEYHEKIFESFFRVPGVSGSRTAGAGVGLAVVREVLERHNGSVVVDSVLGEGTTFELRFPAAITPTTANVLEGHRIYLIDDDPLCVLLTERGLAAAGATLESAGSGEEGLRYVAGAFEHTGPEVVVVDLMLPGMNGVDVLRSLRQHLEPRVPLVLWSAIRDPQAIAAAEAAGAQAFVLKSETMVEDLIATLARVLMARGATGVA